MDLRLHLAERGADAERLDHVTRNLRQELASLDVQSVTALPAGPAPVGTRALDAATVGGVLIALGQSTTALQTIITTIRSWLGRGASVQRTVRVEINGDVLELANAASEEQDRLVALRSEEH